ncbi:MAG: DUF6036 family nucleotidyltransferase [Candidatus Pacearchaeota archaeon]
MIGVERQRNLFIAIGKRLKRKINVYAIGGTAMIFLGLKESTFDIDLVFETQKDRADFKEVLKSLGYEEMNSFVVYGERKNTPEMLTLGDERFDLFVDEVVDFVFSENIRKRAKQLHQFGDNFLLKIADFHDIFVMKCATNRPKDMIDANSIITNTKINWDLIINEAKVQKELKRETAILDLGYFLEELEVKFKVKIPKAILDNLWKLLKKQNDIKRKKRLK